ncbi:regulatory protein RecX [Aminipila butyrica]|uniref:Regulatory protein RecX n=1 Tax=Aminipila butyrica TaxID=433296 RepID=A0A858BVP8_9FIRM|nr:regulatory protein RecX [Aminipila butyrica]QIB69178.1 regulatory protein RecX [Aminipila butyrica]
MSREYRRGQKTGADKGQETLSGHVNMDEIYQTDKEEKQKKKKKDPLEAALKHLAYRDRTCQEMLRHLEEKQYNQEEIQQAMKYLLERHYLDDEAYVERYVEYGISKGKGLVKIRYELGQRGIDRLLLEELSHLFEELEKPAERERALEQGRKLLAGLSWDTARTEPENYEEKKQQYKELQKIKGKVARKLEGQGYTMDDIFYVLDRLFSRE